MKNNTLKSLYTNAKNIIILLSFIAIAGQTNAQCPTAYVTSASNLAGCAAYSSWSYTKEISLTLTGSAITDYRLLLTINTQDLISNGKLRNDGGDLRFTMACTAVPYWIESGLNTSETKIWVKVATVNAASTTVLKMHYGNAGAGFVGSNVASNVFDNNILALYTFTEGSGTVIHDWVGGHDLDMTGTTSWTSGFRTGVNSITGFGGGRAFRGDNGPAVGTGSFTVLDFVYATAATGSTQGIVGNYSGDGTNGWVHKLQGGAGQQMLLTNQGGGWCQASLNGIVNNQWGMAGVRRNSGVTNTLFAAGSSVGNLCGGDARNVNNSGPFEIGRSYNGTGSYAFQGNISLVAIYNSSLSDAEVLALTNGIYPVEQPTINIGNEQLGVLCEGLDLTIDLSNSDTGVEYQLYQTETPVQSAKAGTGSPLSWTVSGLTPGQYDFNIIGSNPMSECSTPMTDNALVNVMAANGGSITAVQPAGSVYTGGVATNLYLGYGADKDTLKSAGFAGNVTWSPASNLSCTGCPKTIYTATTAGTYTITAQDVCQTKTVTIVVRDIRHSGTGSNAKVYLCHKEPVSNVTGTQAVLVRGVPAHFANHPGDKLGYCGMAKRDGITEIVIEEIDLEVSCTPNPFQKSFNLKFESMYDANATVSVYGMTGNLIEKKNLAGFANEVELGTNLPNGIYTVSFVIGDRSRIFKMIKVD